MCNAITKLSQTGDSRQHKANRNVTELRQAREKETLKHKKEGKTSHHVTSGSHIVTDTPCEREMLTNRKFLADAHLQNRFPQRQQLSPSNNEFFPHRCDHRRNNASALLPNAMNIRIVSNNTINNSSLVSTSTMHLEDRIFEQHYISEPSLFKSSTTLYGKIIQKKGVLYIIRNRIVVAMVTYIHSTSYWFLFRAEPTGGATLA